MKPIIKTLPTHEATASSYLSYISALDNGPKSEFWRFNATISVAACAIYPMTSRFITARMGKRWVKKASMI